LETSKTTRRWYELKTYSRPYIHSEIRPEDYDRKRPVIDCIRDFNNDGIRPLKVPGFGHPIDFDPYRHLWPHGPILHGINNGGPQKRLTVRELAMLRFMEAITDKPDWETKVFSEEIGARWRREAEEQSGGMIDDTIFEWLIAELRDKAKESQETGIVNALDSDCVVARSDTLIEDSLREELASAAKRLVSQTDPDWHPGSKDQVLNLVHPSLYPLVYGQTKVLTSHQTSLTEPFRVDGASEVTDGAQELAEMKPDRSLMHWVDERDVWSTKFQWLPCDVGFVGETGTEVAIKSYVNNLHPIQHKGMYDVLRSLISKSIALWNRMLMREYGYMDHRVDATEAQFDPAYPSYDEWPTRWMECDENCDKWNAEMIEKLKKYHEQNPINPLWKDPHPFDECPPGPDELENLIVNGPQNWQDHSPWHLVYDRWLRSRRLVHPMPGLRYEEWKAGWTPEFGSVQLDKEFRDRGLQVIAKLSSIELTPDKSKYEGGNWHLEGMHNERIVATSIYYYDVENVTTARISFRQSAGLDDYDMNYEQGDHAPFAHIFGIESGWADQADGIQELGSVATREGRLLAFPNTLHHRVEPFELDDKSKPGHRRFLVLWLIDPHFRVLSTANVPPQQKEWWDEAGVSPDSTNDCRPVQNLMKLDEAKKHRLELMKERTRLNHEVEMGVEVYHFCEH
jgi:hypothetical protein